MLGLSDHTISVFIVDQQPLLVLGMKAALSEFTGVEVAGSTSTNELIISEISSLQPNVAIIGCTNLSNADIALIRSIVTVSPKIYVIVMCEKDRPGFVREALAAGAKGFLSKLSGPDFLIQCIRNVCQDNTYVDPSIACKLISQIGPVSSRQLTTCLRDPLCLTAKEEKIMKYIAFGLSAKEIGSKLGITSKTVETYKLRAMQKLKLRGRAMIVRHAIARGWFQEAELRLV